MTKEKVDDSDLDVVAPLVVEYYNWLSDNGGKSPEELLQTVLSPRQRKLLLERMDDINVVYNITSPLRGALPKDTPPWNGDLN